MSLKSGNSEMTIIDQSEKLVHCIRSVNWR